MHQWDWQANRRGHPPSYIVKKHTQSLFTNFAVAAVIYGVSLAASWLFQTAEHGLPPIWPASRVALSAMLLLGGCVWIGIFLPLCISSLVAGDPWLCSVLSSAGMTLSIWLGTFLLRRQKFDLKISSTRDILLLAGLGVALPMALAGVWSATCLIIAGKIPATYLWTISSVF